MKQSYGRQLEDEAPGITRKASDGQRKNQLRLKPDSAFVGPNHFVISFPSPSISPTASSHLGQTWDSNGKVRCRSSCQASLVPAEPSQDSYSELALTEEWLLLLYEV